MKATKILYVKELMAFLYHFNSENTIEKSYKMNESRKGRWRFALIANNKVAFFIDGISETPNTSVVRDIEYQDAVALLKALLEFRLEFHSNVC